MRRGSIEFSASTVVVMIVAVVLLGLIIALVVKFTGSVERSFEQEAAKIPEPRAPTSQNPITASTLNVAQGDSFVMKIRSISQGDVEVTPLLLCDSDIGGATVNLVEEQQAFFRASEDDELRWLLVGKIIADAPVKTSVCRLFVAGEDSTGALVKKQVDVPITILT